MDITWKSRILVNEISYSRPVLLFPAAKFDAIPVCFYPEGEQVGPFHLFLSLGSD
jgi:hypothetical protein